MPCSLSKDVGFFSKRMQRHLLTEYFKAVKVVIYWKFIIWTLIISSVCFARDSLNRLGTRVDAWLKQSRMWLLIVETVEDFEIVVLYMLPWFAQNYKVWFAAKMHCSFCEFQSNSVITEEVSVFCPFACKYSPTTNIRNIRYTYSDP